MKEEKKMSRFKAVPNGEEKCIWMEAGVIDYKLCNYYYNCSACPFDKAMKQTTDKNAAARLQGLEPTGKKAHIISWQEKMKKRPGLQRECRHALTGRTTSRLCPYEFECHTCEFDQMLEDSWQMQIPARISTIPQVDGFGLPEGHFFHLGHAWARVEHGGRIRIGLDDFAMKVFGAMDSLDLRRSSSARWDWPSSERARRLKRFHHFQGWLPPKIIRLPRNLQSSKSNHTTMAG
jgi:hypothetical protein